VPNRIVFQPTLTVRTAPPIQPGPATTTNAAGGIAYEVTAKQAVAQIAATNCFNGTFYQAAQDNLALAKQAALALTGEADFLAKVAVYSRTKGYMKDMPAFLLAVLHDADVSLFGRVFPLVIDNGKMLRNFCQIARSGAAGRPLNLSSKACRTAINGWFERASARQIFNASIGNEFPLRDLLRAARVRPSTNEKAALLAYLRGTKLENGKEGARFVTYRHANGRDASDGMRVQYSHPYENLPEFVQQYERYKADKSGPVPNVDFRKLDSLGIGTAEWTQVALNASWQTLRMNLNTFQRHGVFNDPSVVRTLANRLRDPQEIAQARVFPYQLMTAWKATERSGLPSELRDALQDAMEIACDNVPVFQGVTYVCTDTSGSMDAPATGTRKGATSKATCLDVAALMTAAILRKNRTAMLLPFATSLKDASGFNARDSIATNATKMAALGGGGTNCSAPLAHLNALGARGDLVIFLSDYESWVDSNGYNKPTQTLAEWAAFQKRNPKAKMICIDLAPRGNAQVQEHPNILQVGGFSDQVFNVISSFVEAGHDRNHWVSVIENVSLESPVAADEPDFEEEEEI
jgi:60 kDa SS-A/Ro ribonucleoprotein